MIQLASHTRGLPHNIETEKSLLGGLLLDPSLVPDVRASIAPDDFYTEIHRRIYDAMLELDNAGNPIDIMSVADELTKTGWFEKIGGNDALIDITEFVPTAASVRYHAEIVKTLSIRRKIIMSSGRIVEDAHDPSVDIEVLIDKAQDNLNRINSEHSSQTISATEAVRLLEAELASDNRIQGLRTGYWSVDELTGGLRNGIYVVAGPPKMGKSMFTMDIAYNIAHQGKRVLVYSLEMPVELIQKREISKRTGIKTENLKNYLSFQDTLRQKVKAELEVLRGLPIEYANSWEASLSEVRNLARRMASEPAGLDLIVIDYLQLMQYTMQKNTTEAQQIGSITRGLTIMAKNLGCTILLVSQLNRQYAQRNDHKPQVSDLRSSGSIEQDAHGVLLCHREDAYKDNVQDHDKKFEVSLAAHRHGAPGVVVLEYDFSKATFTDSKDEPPF